MQYLFLLFFDSTFEFNLHVILVLHSCLLLVMDLRDIDVQRFFQSLNLLFRALQRYIRMHRSCGA